MARKTQMNKITTPELLSRINSENKSLLNDFLEYLRSTGRSDGTIASYQNDIEIAFVWNLEHNGDKPFVEWTKRNVIAYQNWLLNTNKNSPARIRRLKAALSSMSNYIENLLDDEYPNFRNIINKIESPANAPVREKTVLTDEQVKSMLDALIKRNRIKAACYIALAAYGGRRKSEICRFRVDDFADDKLVCEGCLWKSAPIKTKGRSRGKFIPCYTLVKKFKPYLDLWLAERERLGIESVWLFPADDNPNDMLKISTVNSWMKTASRLSGLDIYTHSFRHFYTTMLSNEGIPDGVIKEILGWEDVSMVAVYNDRSTEDTLDMYFGADGVKRNVAKGLTDL